MKLTKQQRFDAIHSQKKHTQMEKCTYTHVTSHHIMYAHTKAAHTITRKSFAVLIFKMRIVAAAYVTKRCHENPVHCKNKRDGNTKRTKFVSNT